ncbi:coiled-coil domain-containing protein [Plastoroseomonas hellenica]|uniref:hypothetical protein n=1 Tax=Plastoroseomonas hellenica TaxID=2687306 RepID=UPI001BA5A150|nr:hypothetical protein [Plastoroseomonas hellenica]MBR0641277.1 hypothetical protein [Plastoroseomonas hellenica]
MSTYGAARQAKSTKTEQRDTTAVRRADRSSTEETPNIQGNTFHKIIVQAALTPEQKMQEVAKALEFAGTREENRDRIKEFDAFKEYMQSISEEMSKQRIAMTDTETFAELQRVYGDFNNDLNDFIDAMKPLTDITDALYKLRENGQTREALARIKEDREWDEKHARDVEQATTRLDELKARQLALENENIALAQDKGFFGYGAIRSSSMAKIKVNEAEITRMTAEIKDLTDKIAALTQEKDQKSATRLDSAEIGKLRELLDLTTEEHVKQQAALVERALAFVNNGKTRFGSIRSHLDKMVQQIEGLGDNNSNMVQTYAVLNEATKLAETSNQRKREELIQAPDGENLIDKMKREQSKQDIDEHIGILATATVDTMQAYGELTAEAIKIRNMEAATKKQGESARAMHSRGIASVASQLSTVMTAVNSAAINEAQAMAGSTLAEMTRVTNEVARKESIRIATGREDVNTDLEEMLNQLAQFGDVQREATAITRDALTRMRENLAELEGLATDVGKDTQEFVGVAADVVAGVSKPEEKSPPPPSATPSPFKL